MKKFLTLAIIFYCFSGVSNAQTYDCFAKKKCPKNALCSDLGIRVSITDEKVTSLKDISRFDRLTIEEFTQQENILSVSGKQQGGLFYIQMNIIKPNNAGTLTTPFGHRYLLNCEKI